MMRASFLRRSPLLFLAAALVALAVFGAPGAQPAEANHYNGEVIYDVFLSTGERGTSSFRRHTYGSVAEDSLAEVTVFITSDSPLEEPAESDGVMFRGITLGTHVVRDPEDETVITGTYTCDERDSNFRRGVTPHATPGYDYIDGVYPIDFSPLGAPQFDGHYTYAVTLPLLVKKDDVSDDGEAVVVCFEPGDSVKHWKAATGDGQEKLVFEIDDTTGVVGLAQPYYRVVEGTTLRAHLVRAKSTDHVPFTLTLNPDGTDTATRTSDYDSTATIDASMDLGESRLFIPVNIPINNDTTCEPGGETFTIRLSSSWEDRDRGIRLLDPRTTRVRILDNGDDLPTPPSNLYAFLEGGMLTATWGVALCDPTGYELEYRAGTSGSWNSEFTNDVKFKHEVSSLTGTVYQVRVRAKNGAGNGSWATYTVRPPSQLTGLTMTDGTNALTLIPTDSTGGVTGFRSDHRLYGVRVAPGTSSVKLTPTWTGTGSLSIRSRETNMGRQGGWFSTKTVSTSGSESAAVSLASARPTWLQLVVTISGHETTNYDIYVLHANDWDAPVTAVQNSPGCPTCGTGSEVGAVSRYAGLIAQMYQWRNDPEWSSYKSHTDRWDRALKAFGETLADTALTPMTADEAQAFADSGLTRWAGVAAALRDIESGRQQQPNRAPTVSAALADVTSLEAGSTRSVSLAGVFEDADGDSLTVSAASSDEAVATVSVAAGYSTLTLTGVSEGTATVTVTAEDAHGARVGDDFDVSVAGKHAALVAKIKEWRNDPKWSSYKAHTDRWDRALKAFGETVDDASLTAMTAAEAQAFADRGSAWSRWVEVAAALSEIEAGGDQGNQDPPPNQSPTVSNGIADATIVNESGTEQVSLSGVFGDDDGDDLTVTAASSDEAKAAVSVASDYSSLTVTAKARGTATITVTADDGKGGTAEDSFTVTVKAAPTVASAIGDISGLERLSARGVSLSGVFSDGDGDDLTITAASSNEDVAYAVLGLDNDLSVFALDEGTATITVTAQDSDGNSVSDAFEVSVVAAPQPQQQEPPNQAPTVSSAISDATIVNPTRTHQVSLSGVFSDDDNDALTITATSDNDAVATVSVASDQSRLTVSAHSRGTATITVTADDGKGGTVEDSFTVTVKSGPDVASAIADVTGLEAGSTRDVSLSGVFSDADGDAITVTASSDDEAVATVSAASDHSALTIAGVSAGDATITVFARDADGNRAVTYFDVDVTAQQTRPETETETDTETSDIVSRYDADGNGAIDVTEWRQAQKDYAAGKFSYTELLKIIMARR